MNYAEQPASLAEKRAFEKGDCQLWSPRDLLLYYLRRIDEGETFDGMMVVYLKKDPVRGVTTGFHRAQVTMLECVGALEAAKFDMLKED
jgi:hypothetical protein